MCVKPWVSTVAALALFEQSLPNMGKVVRIIGTAEHRRYRVKFICDDGRSFEFRGFSWWYRGEGPGGLAKCLRKLGVDAGIIQQLTSYNPGTHGHADNPNCFFINLDGKDPSLEGTG